MQPRVKLRQCGITRAVWNGQPTGDCCAIMLNRALLMRFTIRGTTVRPATTKPTAVMRCHIQKQGSSRIPSERERCTYSLATTHEEIPPRISIP